MSDTAADTLPTWRYRAVGRDGVQQVNVIQAEDERAAMRRLSAEGYTVTSLHRVQAKGSGARRRDLKPAERVLVIRQMALMLEAGVSLLEALDTVASGMEAQKGREAFREVASALRRGDRLGEALSVHAPGFPFYLYSMIEVGEASGRIAEVLRDAADQMAYEEQLRRDFVNALTYPAFLGSVGLLAVLFIFTQVVPRFSAMIGDATENLPWISRVVLDIGAVVSEHTAWVLGVLIALGAAGLAAATNPAMQARAYRIGLNLPVLGGILKAREITSWARLTAFALANGVPLLEAVSLSRQAAPEGAFRASLAALETDLRAGMTLDASLSQHTRLSAMDLSLIRTGQRTGALARMFGFLAAGYDAKLRDQMKRFTALLEPLAIGFISIIVGVVALSLVMALSSVYDTVG